MQKSPYRERWKEPIQGTLISIGSKADKGNRLTRFESINGQLYLRITTGNREFIPLKPLLVEGVWDRVRYSNGLVPLSAGGHPDEGFFEQPRAV